MWRYEAIDLRTPGQPVRRVGEIAGATAAEARAALRAVGLQVLDIRPERTSKRPPTAPGIAPGIAPGSTASAASATDAKNEETPSVRDRLSKRTGARKPGMFEGALRGRRMQERADAFDALATLLESGVPLVEAVETLAETHEGRSRPLRRVLLEVREELRAGKPLSESLAMHGGWFDPAEVAMVEAAQVAGTLAPTLAEIASRQARSAAVAQRLVSALAYPAIVSIVGAAVAAFLATQTLPQLSAILASAKIETPPLTAALMAAGAFLARWWPMLLVALAGGAVGAAILAPRLVRAASPAWRSRLDRLVPLAVRRMAVARALLRIADLLRAGVPLVEALRTVGPGCTGLSSGLGASLLAAARRLEEGEDFSGALSGKFPGAGTGVGAGDAWFDAESRRLIAVGEAGGELAPVLQRLGERYERQTARLVERLAALLEPAAVVALAVLVGTVVMAAVLPLLRLQEIL